MTSHTIGIATQAMGALQEAGHGHGHDYERGSPHLRHAKIRSQIVGRIRQLIAEQFERKGGCRVLEVGAGHGGFTDHVAATGAEVTVTEMSRASLDVLADRLGCNPRVRLVYDPDGDAVFNDTHPYDLVLCISVLHHVPDYLRFIERIVSQVQAGGAFASFQDPLWYPRRSKTNLCLDRGAYGLWRLTQGKLLSGLRTQVRRARGVYDESNPADMVEYHVVRNGVDEVQIEDLLRTKFASVEQWRYWSTQNPLLQTIGTRLRVETTFGVIGYARTNDPPGAGAS